MTKLAWALGGCAALALAACGQEAPQQTETPTAEAAAETAPTAEITRDEHVGTWDVTYPDGSTGVSTVNADGTYERTVGDEALTTGTWTFEGAETCMTTDGDTIARCYHIGAPDENGTRIGAMPDGKQITITPVTTG